MDERAAALERADVPALVEALGAELGHHRPRRGARSVEALRRAAAG